MTVHGPAGGVCSSPRRRVWVLLTTCLAVNLGEDADTTGAVYGQIAGAYYGASDIPESWREKITLLDKIESYAGALLARDGGSMSTPVGFPIP